MYAPTCPVVGVMTEHLLAGDGGGDRDAAERVAAVGDRAADLAGAGAETTVGSSRVAAGDRVDDRGGLVAGW